METKIIIKEVHVTKHVELKVEINGNININNMLSLKYIDNTYYFKPLELYFTDKGTTAILKECGYWADRLSNVSGINYKCLIGLKLSIITDKEIIKQIDEENTYC